MARGSIQDEEAEEVKGTQAIGGQGEGRRRKGRNGKGCVRKVKDEKEWKLRERQDCAKKNGI